MTYLQLNGNTSALPRFKLTVQLLIKEHVNQFKNWSFEWITEPMFTCCIQRAVSATSRCHQTGLKGDIAKNAYACKLSMNPITLFLYNIAHEEELIRTSLKEMMVEILLSNISNLSRTGNADCFFEPFLSNLNREMKGESTVKFVPKLRIYHFCGVGLVLFAIAAIDLVIRPAPCNGKFNSVRQPTFYFLHTKSISIY